MLKLRLQRVGRKNDPSFRIVAQDSRRAPSSKVLEILGFYNPRLKQKKLDKDRVKHWLKHGAQPTDTVYNLLVDEWLVAGPKKNVVRTKASAAASEETESSAQEAGSPSPETQEQVDQATGDVQQAEPAGTPEEKQT